MDEELRKEIREELIKICKERFKNHKEPCDNCKYRNPISPDGCIFETSPSCWN